MRFVEGLTKRYAADATGGVAIIFGLSSFVLFGVVTIALDMSRVQNTQQRVQAALDAAALAAAKMLDDEYATDTEVSDKAEAYMNARLVQMRVDNATTSNFQVVVNRSNFSVNVATDVQVTSYFGRLAQSTGVLDFTESATVSYEQKKIELAMVVDVSGSMHEPDNLGTPKIDSLRQAGEDIVNVMAATGPAAGSIRVALAPYSTLVNAGSYFDDATNGASHADTCLTDRSGSHAYDDYAPSSSTKSGTIEDYEMPPGWYVCPTTEINPLTDISLPTDRDQLITSIQSLQANGFTAGHIGLAWGWYMISSNWTSIWPEASDPKPKSPQVIKAVILMTDGELNMSYGNQTSGSPYLKNANPSSNGSSPDQARKICDNMRDEGVVIYSVAFMAPTLGEETLHHCSGDNNFLKADNGSELRDAFKKIGERLTSLRIAQ